MTEETQDICDVCGDVLLKGYVALDFGGRHFHVVKTVMTDALKATKN